MENKDIFNIYEKDSLVRRVLERKKEIDLKDLNLPTYKIPEDFSKKEFQIHEEKYASKIREIITPLANHAENEGYSPSIFTALYESVLNAYQHGNKKDKNKKIKIYYNINDEKAHFLVEDQGGKIKSSFASYILAQREKKDHQKSFLNFYDDDYGEKINEENNGTGISFMYAYLDKIGFYTSENEGLIVEMLKEKQKIKEKQKTDK